jgi:hypothetical protein
MRNYFPYLQSPLLRNNGSTNGTKWMLLPLAGSGLFFVLYFLAAAFYPGGSQADAGAKGFSWMHNYWCNLLPQNALNGERNGGRPFAIAGMAVLAIVFISTWLLSARVLLQSKPAQRVMQATAVLSMLPLVFLTTEYHDQLLMLTALFGLVAMGLVYAALYRARKHGLFWFGLFNVLLIAVNNYIYYLAPTRYWLPLVQKFTFLSYLLWICLLSLMLYRLQRSTVRKF